ncbi:dye-decolorizing heme-containing peroxidase [Naematelia encephala]|uniref:Dye-decolorizing heme-containing peroxidase n=1 Tax=Naematelia encephala TaxID=71784 RepID=A0A1Y2B8B1_9TREE|nr:dye-decolorizing heme-containing peroxidase [Naematelia encephala]
MPPARQQQCKSDTLTLTSYASAFLAALSPRLTLADEKRASNLTTAEVYATWASREVGWSFIIEGTREAALADRRTTSWSADESGKRAVMLLLRVWWYRTASNEDSDIDSKIASRDTVETVVRRMKDKEGMNGDDVVRFKDWLLRWDGEMDQTEELFWKTVLQVLGE